MDQDLLSVLTGGKQSLGATPQGGAPMSAPSFSNDVDAAVRTVYGEADPAGRQAVAAVIRNRAQKAGVPLSAVVTEPGQFEAWSNPKARARMESLSPDSPEYQKIAQEIAPVLAGEVDPTNGADAYYNPTLQKSLGRNAPAWDNGTGQKIGAQMFFSGVYAPKGGTAQPDNQDLMAILGGGKQPQSAAAQQPSANAPRVSNEFVVQGSGKPSSAMNPAQLKTYQQLAAAGVIDTKKMTQATDAGTLKMPYVQTDPDVVPEGPGVYYVDLAGQLQQTPGKPVGHMEGLAEGAKQGVLDVYGSVANLEKGLAKVNPILGAASNANINPFIKYSPFYSDEEKARAGGQGGAFGMMSENEQAARDAFNARYGASGYATTGRIGGNIVASAPIMAAGGGALTAAGEASPIGAFLAGQAGRAPGVANLLLRGGSLATRGAIEGAEGAGLTSSSSDVPIQEQLAQGAMLGGGLGVAAPVLISGAKGVGAFGQRLVEPFTESGQQSIVNRLISKIGEGGPLSGNAAEMVPGSVPTLAQATQNMGLGSLERAARATPQGAIAFAQRDAKNASARNALVSNIISNDADFNALASRAQGNASQRLDDIFANARPSNAPQAVQQIDAILAGPAGKIRSVSGPAQQIRKALASEASGLTPQNKATFEQGIMKAMGSDASHPSQAAMQENKQRLSQIFEDIGAKTKINADDKFRYELGNAILEAGKVLPESEYKPLLRQVDDIESAVGDNGMISGVTYQRLISRGSPLDRAISSKGNVGFYAQKIRDTLDNALERSAAPEDVAALQQARSQYRNMKIAEGAIRRAGPNGEIDPNALMAEVKKANPNFVYKGGGDLGDVASRAVTQAQPRTVYDTRPETMEEAFKAIDNQASKPGAHPEISNLRNQILDVLDNAAPGYKQHVIQTELDNIPVKEQNFLRELGLTDSKDSYTLNKVTNAVNSIENLRNSPNPSDAKSISDATLKKLKMLRDDLKREVTGSDVGKFIGSNSFQNLATSAIVDRLGIPVAFGVGTLAHNPVAAIGLAAAKLAYGSKNEEIQNRLISTLLNPENANLKGGSLSLGGGQPVPVSQVNKLATGVKNQLIPASVIGARNIGDTTGRRKSQPESLNYPIGY